MMKFRDSVHLSNTLCKTSKKSFIKSIIEYLLLITSLVIILFISLSFYFSYSNTFRKNNDLLIGEIKFSDNDYITYSMEDFDLINNHKSIKDSSIFNYKGFRTIKKYSFKVGEEEYLIGNDSEDGMFFNYFNISFLKNESLSLVTKNQKKWLKKNNYGDAISGDELLNNKEVIVNESFLLNNHIDTDIIGKNLSIEYELSDTFVYDNTEKQTINRNIKLINNYKIVGVLNNKLNDINLLYSNSFGDIILKEDDCYDSLNKVYFNKDKNEYVFYEDVNDLIDDANNVNKVFIPTDPEKNSNLMCVYDFKNIESLSKLYKKLNALSLDEGNTYNNINSFHINSLVQSYLYNVDFMNMMVWILSIILIFQITAYILNFYMDISNQFVRLNKFMFISNSFGIHKTEISKIFFINYFKKMLIALIISIPISILACYSLLIKINEHIKTREGISKFKMNYNYYPVSIIVGIMIIISIMITMIVLKSKSNKYFYISNKNQ